MRSSLLFTLFYLFMAAWAGGYQGCLERVWLYQAYLIDSLNDYDDQTIGWQCKGKNWDRDAKKCKEEWTRMPGSRAGSKLSYDQFVHSLGNAKDRTGWAVMSGDELDVKATALNTYTKYTTPQAGQPPGKAHVRNFAPQLAVKDAVEWNQLIMKVGDIVDRTYRAKQDGMNDATKKLFKNFDATRDLVIEARTGDHGSYLIDAAKKGLPDMDIKIEDMGPDPADNTKNWKTVNWPETVRAALEAGDKDPVTEIIKALKEFYNNDVATGPREHLQVIKSFKQLRGQQIACGR